MLCWHSSSTLFFSPSVSERLLQLVWPVRISKWECWFSWPSCLSAFRRWFKIQVRLSECRWRNCCLRSGVRIVDSLRSVRQLASSCCATRLIASTHWRPSSAVREQTSIEPSRHDTRKRPSPTTASARQWRSGSKQEQLKAPLAVASAPRTCRARFYHSFSRFNLV